MKIGVISDTHIPDRARQVPPVIMEAFNHVDMIIHAGDLVEFSVLDKLSGVCKEVKAVRGNMDYDDASGRLPIKEIIKAGGVRIGVMHGWGPPAKLVELMQQEFKDDKVDIVIFGHSHAPFNEKIGNVLYFNPGSATDKVFAPYNSYGIIEITNKIDARIVRI